MRSGEGGKGLDPNLELFFNVVMSCLGYHPAFYPCLNTCESCVRKQNVYQICKNRGEGEMFSRF